MGTLGFLSFRRRYWACSKDNKDIGKVLTVTRVHQARRNVLTIKRVHQERRNILTIKRVHQERRNILIIGVIWEVTLTEVGANNAVW